MQTINFVYRHSPDYADKTCGYGSGHNPKEGKCRDSFNDIVYISNEYIQNIYERADINHCSFLSLFENRNLPTDVITLDNIKNKKGVYPIGLRFDLLENKFESIMSKIICPNLIDLINQNKIMLLIYDATSLVCGIRGFDNYINKLESFLKNKHVNLNNVALITNYIVNNEFCKIIKWNVLETCARLLLQEKKRQIDYTKKLKEFNFLNCARFLLFNSRNRFHRFVLTYKLYTTILNFKNYCWFSLQKISFSQLIKLLHTSGCSEFLNSYNSIASLLPFKSFLKTLPAYIGLEYPYPKGDLSRFINDIVYNKSGIFIVTEGSVAIPPSGHLPFLTEKVFKTIGFKMPFIFYGEPGSLQFLKTLGYKTFDKIWDESYDSIIDPVERADAITKLVSHLCSLNDKEFLEILKRTCEIVEHNYNMLQLRQTENTLVEHICNFVNT
jgi:hypothetical protein